ncbi:branched-chain amino acid ABC transporter permease [Natronorubrum sp. FCH18a]|uniref:branched-chain amino acid ABC transporter permease n=1 Tax=Natronorubrum sp. FCH18a TaxID=3447018 RepID=UPI003F512529
MTLQLNSVVDNAQSTAGIKFLVIAGLLVLMPFAIGARLANEILIFAIFALGYNFLLGYGGELSFGHSAYFGLGAYGTVLAIEHLTASIYLAVALGVLFTTVTGVVFGYVSLRRRGIYFAMITLALAMLVYYVVQKWTGFTGGDDGASVPIMDASIGPIDPTNGGFEFYVFGLLILLLVWLVFRRVLHSSYGRTLIAIRENEERARHLGYEVNRHLLVAFTFSALVSGLAGALFATAFAFITPELLFWAVSGEIVLIALMGGIGTLGGPIVGAIAFILVQDTAVNLTHHWELVFGGIIILFVLFIPEGLYGKFTAYFEDKTQPFDADALRDRFDADSIRDRFDMK